MHDQANALRRLVNTAPAPPVPPAPGPQRIVLSGGKGGVGTTTTAVNLALELVRLGHATWLIDADPEGGDAATLCGTPEPWTLADVLAQRRPLEEAVQPGPHGLRVLPGAWGLDLMAECSPAAQEHLIRQLHRLTSPVRFVLLDAGHGTSRFARRLWQDADQILVVTTTELTSVMDTYALIKVLARGNPALRIRTVANTAPDDLVAADVHARLARACLRFLGIHVRPAGHLPNDPQLARSAASIPELRALAERVAGGQGGPTCLERTCC